MHDSRMHPVSRQTSSMFLPQLFFFLISFLFFCAIRSHTGDKMSSSATPTPPLPPLSGLSGKKRKYDQLDRVPPPLPPTGSLLYVALYALPLPERRGGVLDYRWTFLLAPDDRSDTRGRQYSLRETGSKVQPCDAGASSSKELGVVARRFQELALEQRRKREGQLLSSQPFSGIDDQQLREWEFEIQDVCVQSSAETRVRVQLPRIQDVESFEALVQDAFLASEGCRGPDWNHVLWMRDVWTALAEDGDAVGGGGLKSELVGWEMVQKTALGFVQARESEGRFEKWDSSCRVPTWGLLERRRLV